MGMNGKEERRRAIVECEDEGTLFDVAKYRISSAKSLIKIAEYNYNLGCSVSSENSKLAGECLKTAVNRSYYAVFSAVNACLALKGKAYKSHKQVLGNFNREFMNGTYDIPKDTFKQLRRLQEIRHECDYNDFYIISREDTGKQVEIAKKIVEVLERTILAIEEQES